MPLLISSNTICSLVTQDRGHRCSARGEEKIPNLAHFYVLSVLPCLDPTDMRSIVPNSIRPYHSIVLSCLLFNIIFSFCSSVEFLHSPSSPTFLCSALPSFLLFYLTFRLIIHSFPPTYPLLPSLDFSIGNSARTTEEKERLNKGS